MHDEDNAIGLDVINPTGFSWRMYGDNRLLDEVDLDNQKSVVKAVQTSADEVFQAWSTQKMPTLESYQAWQYAPLLDSARSTTQALAPLFTFEDQPQRRTDIKNRQQWQFTSDYWYSSTALACKTSGLWAYPITLGVAGASTSSQPNRK